MMGLPIRIELANLVVVQRSHDADPRQHRRAAFRRDQDQGLHRRLPLRHLVLCFGQLRDVERGVAQRASRKCAILNRRLQCVCAVLIVTGGLRCPGKKQRHQALLGLVALRVLPEQR
jgi:hypothetical protein